MPRLIRRFIACSALIVLALYCYSYASSRAGFETGPTVHGLANSIESTIENTIENTFEFIHSNTPISLDDTEPFVPNSIQAVCKAQKWKPQVFFTCEKSVGGVGNIRNSVLNCVRYAIEAGGGLVIPKIVVRNNSDITKIRTGEVAGLDYMFDKEHFVQSLKVSCPELQLFNEVHDIPNYMAAHASISLLPESLFEGDKLPRTGWPHPEEFRTLFDNWVRGHNTQGDKVPTIVDLERSYIKWPIYYDGYSFAFNFGRILKFRADVRELAAFVLMELAEKFALNITSSEPYSKNAYFGAHLRTELDATAGWPPGQWNYSRYDVQSKLYLEQAPRSSISVIYVASGNITEVTKFAKDAAVHELKVTTKTHLLEGANLERLNSLPWDVQALVDYMIMERASDFAGVAHSSFAWNIAVKRHGWSKVENYLDGPQMLSDELSQIYGVPRGYPEYVTCLWP